MFTPPFKGDGRQAALPGDDQGRRALRRHRSGPLLPHLHDLLRELHSAPVASRSRTRTSTAAMSTSSPRTPWPTAPTCATSAPTTTAARRSIRRSSRNSAVRRRSASRTTARICSPARSRRSTGSSAAWAPGLRSAGAPTLRGLPTRTSSTCPPLRPSCGPGPQQDPLSKYLYENLSPRPRQLLSGPARRPLCAAAWPRT